jgi:hypothetical protein
MTIYTALTILFVIALLGFIFSLVMLLKEYVKDDMKFDKIIHYEVNLHANLILMWIAVMGRMIVQHFTK